MLNLVVASSYPKGAIGQAGDLPWSLPGDLAYFRRITTRNPSAILMGRRTWESFGCKPLPRRMNIVISQSLCSTTERKNDNSLMFVPTLAAAIAFAGDLEIFVIGGAQLYAEAAKYPGARIYHTEIYGAYPGADVFWKIPDDYTMIQAEDINSTVDGRTEAKMYYRRLEWIRKESLTTDAVLSAIPRVERSVNPEEMQYLDLLKRIFVEGQISDDRTGTGTKSIMGGHFRFNLRSGFPAITTKPLFWKGVVEELLWLLSGDTNAKHLASIGVHIWDDDTSRGKLDKRKMYHLAEGDCGATYGFNMRHYGAEYKGCLESYDGLGEDQFAKCVDTLMKNPSDRRIIINLWDPTQLRNCALPPCLLMYVFYVSNNELSCFTVQRSADMMLGVPFNIASSSLFTEILSNMTGLLPGEVDHNMVNAHIYLNHMAAALEQMQRQPFAKPILRMPTGEDGSEKKITLADFEPAGPPVGDAVPRKLSFRDFVLIGYRNHPALKNPTPLST